MNENEFDTQTVDRIGAKLTTALFRCIDNLDTDNLCILLAKAFHLLDEQEVRKCQ